MVVPQTAGTLEIPALAFSSFGPTLSRIVRNETPALPLRVEGGAESVPEEESPYLSPPPLGDPVGLGQPEEHSHANSCPLPPPAAPAP